MGNQVSKERPARTDSVQSQEAMKNEMESSRPVTSQSSTEVKRKPVPAVQKGFRSLADLGSGPRGGKGGPLPLMVKPRKQSVDREETKSEDSTSMTQERASKASTKSQAESDTGLVQQKPLPTLNQMPPTPQEESSLPTPPPKKAGPFMGMGLPSNPRAKGQETPKHVRGKSSTGFDMMKVCIAIAPLRRSPFPSMSANIKVNRDLSFHNPKQRPTQ